MLFILGCMKPPPEPPKVSKTIINKIQSVESGIGFGVNFDGGMMMVPQSETVFRLIAEDNSFIIVNWNSYIKTKIGDIVASQYWRKLD